LLRVALTADALGRERSTDVQLLTPKEVRTLLSLSKTTLWRMCRDGTFPKPLKISSRRTAFVAEEIERWMKARLGMPAPGLAATAGDASLQCAGRRGRSRVVVATDRRTTKEIAMLRSRLAAGGR
jgi:prophage regulatory protein